MQLLIVLSLGVSSCAALIVGKIVSGAANVVGHLAGEAAEQYRIGAESLRNLTEAADELFGMTGASCSSGNPCADSYQCVLGRCAPIPNAEAINNAFKVGLLATPNPERDLQSGLLGAIFCQQVGSNEKLTDVTDKTCDSFNVTDTHSAVREGELQNTFAFYKGPNFNVLSFRGTGEGRDVTNDLMLNEAPFELMENCGRVHSEFQIAFNLHRDRLNEIFSQAQNQGPLFITGHSLGAAIASFAAIHMATKFPKIKIISVTTYGGPKLGDRNFVDCYTRTLKSIHSDIILRRFVLSSSLNFQAITTLWDPVSLVPARYLHITDDGLGIQCSSEGGCKPGLYHSIQYYIDSLQKLLGSEKCATIEGK